METKDEHELMERRLADGVRERVENTLKFRYGAFFSIVLAVAGFFGYDLINSVKREVTKGLEELTEKVDKAASSVEAFEPRIHEFEGQLLLLREEFDSLSNKLDTFNATYQEIEEKTGELQEILQATREAQNEFIREQVNIIARKFGETLDLRKNETSAFYQAIREFARERDFTQVEVFATVQLAINRGANNDTAMSRELFAEAEQAAKSLNHDEFLNVLIERARSESDMGFVKEAIFTLKERALKSLVDASDDVSGKVYQNIANIYAIERDYAEAISHYRTAAAHFSASENLSQEARIYLTIGNIFVRKELTKIYNPDKAKSALNQAIEIAGYINDRYVLYGSHMAMSDLLDGSGEARRHICKAASYADGPPLFRPRVDIIRQFSNDQTRSFEEYCKEFR